MTHVDCVSFRKYLHVYICEYDNSARFWGYNFFRCFIPVVSSLNNISRFAFGEIKVVDRFSIQ